MFILFFCSTKNNNRETINNYFPYRVDVSIGCLVRVSYDSFKNPFLISFAFNLWTVDTCLEPCQGMANLCGYFTFPHQESFFPHFCTPFTFCLFMETIYVYFLLLGHACSFFLMPLVPKLFIENVLLCVYLAFPSVAFSISTPRIY